MRKKDYEDLQTRQISLDNDRLKFIEEAIRENKGRITMPFSPEKADKKIGVKELKF